MVALNALGVQGGSSCRSRDGGTSAEEWGHLCALRRANARRACAYVRREDLGFLMCARPPVGIYGKVFLLET